MKRMKKIVSLIAALAIACSLFAASADGPGDDAALPGAEEAGNILYIAGFLSGGDSGLNLSKEPTRVEATAAFLKLMGMLAEVEANTDEIPFEDVPEWAVGYVSVMYKNGWSKGVSDTSFGALSTVNANQFYTFVLRGLGYRDGEDFDYSEAVLKALELGIIDEATASGLEDSSFNRGDMAVAMYSALKANEVGSDITLIERLYNDGRADKFACEIILGTNEVYNFMTSAKEASESLLNFSAKAEITGDISAMGETMKIAMTENIKCDISDDKMKIFMDIITDDPTGEGDDIGIYIYLEDEAIYVKEAGVWTKLPDVAGMTEMINQIMTQANLSSDMIANINMIAYKDMSYEKSGDDIIISGDIDVQGIMDLMNLDEMLGIDPAVGMNISPIKARLVFDAATYMPKSTEMEFGMSMDIIIEDETLSTDINISMNMEISDIGSTVITLDDELKALIAEE